MKNGNTWENKTGMPTFDKLKSGPEERALKERFGAFYATAQAPVIVEIERCVCGCDYGGSSWATIEEVERIGAWLELRPGLRLLELGAGSGWPGLYLAKTTGCDIVLVDLPLEGLQAAAARVLKERISGTCWLVAGDARGLPFRDHCVDAISHADVLCCLREKRAVLEACRGVIRGGGRMVFSVISITPGLSPDDNRRGVEGGPEFIETEFDYATLLEQTGWTVREQHDITADYTASCGRMLQAEQERKEDLTDLLGASGFALRHEKMRLKFAAAQAGLHRRELFIATWDQARI